MGKLVLAVMAVALVFGSFSLVAQADSPQSFFNQVCKDADNFGFKNHGKCVSFFAKRLNNDGPAKLCKTELFPGFEFWEIPFFNFKNRGDCVSTLRGL